MRSPMSSARAGRQGRSPVARARHLLAALAALAIGVGLVPAASTPAAAALPATLRNVYGARIDAYPAYDAQRTCAKTVTPGVREVAAFFKRSFPGTNPWAYIRGCTIGATSEHKEGRAIDYMLDSRVPAQKKITQNLIAWLTATDKYGNQHAMARRMGIMYMQWNNMMWRSYGSKRGVWERGPYGHIDHIHISFSRAAGAKRTSFFTGHA